MIESIGMQLKEARLGQKLTQKVLAKKVGMTDKHLSEIERGKVVMTMEELEKLCGALGLAVKLV